MNLDELRTVQSKERSKDSLQHLRESFYTDVADYVAELRERRDAAAERADNPFDDPEVNRLTDETHTAEEVVEAIYERRVGKVVKRASLAAAGMPADEEGLTSEEQELFGELVETIETNKQAVLDVLAGEDAGIDMSGGAESESAANAEATASAGTADPAEAPAPDEAVGGSPADETTADVSAADLMGGDSSDGPATGASDNSTATDASATATGATGDSAGSDADGSRSAAPEAAAVADAPAESAAPEAADGDARGATGADAGGTGNGAPAESTADADDPLAGLDERTTVRLTDDVGEIFGVDERTYDLASEDVVTLPEANAEPLVERGAAEKLD
jgi:DNA replication factor GINS